MPTQKPSDQDVVITGIGLVSALGIGTQANWQAFAVGAKPAIDAERFTPYTVHPLPEVEWETQISRRDQRQMEAWQRIGTYAAGLALDDAGMKGEEQYTSTMDMIVAAAGGERDVDVDTMILESAGEPSTNRGVLVNDKLSTELRPTLFLAQLSNLLAGNISIVHKVTGSSRTFMGEEGAGISAIKTAAARIKAGQSTHALVGASYNCEHPDMLLGYEIGQHLNRSAWTSIWDRDESEGGGLFPGSGGAFLVLESRKHAEQRDANIYAVLDDVVADQGPEEKAQKRLEELSGQAQIANGDFIISGASGAKAPTTQEKEFLSAALPQSPVRGFSGATGHMHEVQFPFGIALAALSLHYGQAIAPIDEQFENAISDTPSKIGVLTIGYEEGEGIAVLSKNGGDA